MILPHIILLFLLRFCAMPGTAQHELAGNTIDFFVQVLGLSFNDAMRQITGS